MRSVVSIPILVMLPVALLGQGNPTAPQPDTPAPIQTARPLTLPTLRPPVADTGIFSPLQLPPGNEIRRPNGSPGPKYWQQRVDYQIRARLDTAAKRLTGSEIIRYSNNSPDTLGYLWLQLDQNLFRTGSTGSLLFASESRFGGAGFSGGFEIDSIVQCSTPQEPSGKAPPLSRRKRRARAPAKVPPRCGTAPLRTRVDDTMMYLELASPLPPGGKTNLELSYGFNIPEHGADRMGRDGSLYEIAQWYPRLAVYDDMHGWNTDQYLGQGEFYLEYGTIEYEVTVPYRHSPRAELGCRTSGERGVAHLALQGRERSRRSLGGLT
jgi:hypothetical protein